MPQLDPLTFCVQLYSYILIFSLINVISYYFILPSFIRANLVRWMIHLEIIDYSEYLSFLSDKIYLQFKNALIDLFVRVLNFYKDFFIEDEEQEILLELESHTQINIHANIEDIIFFSAVGFFFPVSEEVIILFVSFLLFIAFYFVVLAKNVKEFLFTYLFDLGFKTFKLSVDETIVQIIKMLSRLSNLFFYDFEFNYLTQIIRHKFADLDTLINNAAELHFLYFPSLNQLILEDMELLELDQENEEEDSSFSFLIIL